MLAGEGRVHALTDHLWHLDVLGRLAAADPATFRATDTTTVDLDDPASEAAATAWWEELTAAGGEGMVVKPVDVVHRGPRAGPAGHQVPRPRVPAHHLRARVHAPSTTSTGCAAAASATSGSLALREFALGIEALERFVAGEPLYRVHECVFGVLALESEPVDPRL